MRNVITNGIHLDDTKSSGAERTAAKVVTQARLMELFDYEYWTGWWVRKIPCGHCKAGERAGSIDKEGYRRIKIDGVLYYSSRLAWLYQTGSFPPPDREIDHRNGRRASDRFPNLRLATDSQNQANRMVTRSSSGQKGVSFHRQKQKMKFRAKLRANGKTRHLGLFDTREAAAAAYWEAAQQAFGRFARRG